MKVKEPLALAALGVTVLVFSNQRPSAQAFSPQVDAASTSQSQAPHRQLVDRNCVTCHNDRLKTAGLTLEQRDLGRLGPDAEIWEKVIRKLRGGMMPPEGRPRPPQPEIDAFVTYLETSIDREAEATPHPGRSPLHRLNRTEYANAIRDLLALEIDVTSLLPPDDESDGFDNIADVLKLSPSLLEQYLSASRKISSLAVGDPTTPPISQIYRVPPKLAQGDHVEGLPLGTRGGILMHHIFPLDAEYDFSVVLTRNIVGYMTGLEWPHQLEISIDGERLFLAPVGGESDNRASDTNMSAAADAIDARLKTRIRVSAGPHAVGVAFLRKSSAESHEPLQPHTRDHDLQNMNGIPLIDYVSITGPYRATGSGDTPSRRRIFECRPADTRRAPGSSKQGDELTCARRILSTLARRAYRRPVTADDVEALVRFYQDGQKRGSFDSGIQNALRFILASPNFLVRSERDPGSVAAGTVYRVSDLELASRLSFFLWSSLPDDELLELAEQGKLGSPAVLEQQVRRMLADPRSQALVTNFAGQWLFLRNLQSVNPDGPEFPDFDDNLRQAFRRETELFFESLIREDRSVLDLLTADYTFVNERLARHYGIPRVYGSHFRRVTLADEHRRGLLGHGSVLTVTSYPDRTSPVLRGKWILENILGTPPPAPPPNVPALEETSPGKPLSVRERTEAHRKNPACAACHKVMDPLGFALENFDAIGEWRTREATGLIDASGQLADGTPVDGPITLRRALVGRSGQFVQTLTEKLLTYALGRGLTYADMPTVRSIARGAAEHDYRFSSLIMGIVRSVPFQMRRNEGSGLTAQGLSQPRASLRHKP
jgi:mono/diheme cytochrome c family protein